MDIEKIIYEHSDYEAHDPYWINLQYWFGDRYKKLKQAMSDSLNDYFDKNGPDANEDYAGCCGPLMKLETARNAIQYAMNQNNDLLKSVPKTLRQELPDGLIDGVGWVESDGRENDPVTGELLHTIPVNKDSTIDELECLLDQDDLSHDDWVWVHFAHQSCGGCDKDTEEAILKIIKKHHNGIKQSKSNS